MRMQSFLQQRANRQMYHQNHHHFSGGDDRFSNDLTTAFATLSPQQQQQLMDSNNNNNNYNHDDDVVDDDELNVMDQLLATAEYELNISKLTSDNLSKLLATIQRSRNNRANNHHPTNSYNNETTDRPFHHDRRNSFK